MDQDRPTQSGFQTTHWTVALAAGQEETVQSNEALSALFTIYWKPLYAYLRHRGQSSHDSQDLLQGFFETLVANRSFFQKADPQRGRFRSFLLGALKNYLCDARDREQALKRGGGHWRAPEDISVLESQLQSPDSGNEDHVFDRRWASSCLEEALDRLKASESERLGLPLFQALIAYISGQSVGTPIDRLARPFDLSNDAFKMQASRLRRRLRESLRQVVMETVSSHSEANEELAYVRELLATGA